MGTTKAARQTPDLTLWGARLTGARLEAGLSQVALAKRVGIDQSALSKMERGLRPPTERQRIALARTLKTTVWALFPYPDDVR